MIADIENNTDITAIGVSGLYSNEFVLACSFCGKSCKYATPLTVAFHTHVIALIKMLSDAVLFRTDNRNLSAAFNQ